MNGFTELLRRLLRTVLRLALIAAAAIFLLSLLLATLIVMLAVTLWAVVTGRKPEPARVFGQFRAASARYSRGSWPGGARAGAGAASTPADIVDVAAHEVRDAPRNSADGAGRPLPLDIDPSARDQR